MPIALLVPLISAAVGAAGIGTSIYEGDKSADAEKAANAGPTQAQLVSQEEQARHAATQQADSVLPGLQEQTGGSVNPGYYQSMSGLLSGNSQYGNSPQFTQAIQQFLGQQGSPGSVGSSTGQIGSQGFPGLGGMLGPGGTAPFMGGFQGYGSQGFGGNNGQLASGNNPQMNPFMSYGLGA